MPSSEEMKGKLEANIAKAFLLEYNLAHGTLFQDERRGQPPEPDRICCDRITGKRIGLEVCVAYYDEVHAKTVWDEFRRIPPDSYPLRDSEIEIQRLLQSIRKLLDEKSGKSYSEDYPVFLLIMSQPLRIRLTAIREHLAGLSVPPRHPFSAVFLMNNIEGEVLQLFPEWKWILPSGGRY